jgi:hypothetical protein
VTLPSQFQLRGVSLAMDLSPDAPAFNAATTPVVLRIMPLPGSLAPIGYIYNPNPTHDGDGGLLAAASTFFTHQGHQVFHDPCPDLAAYCKDWRVTATIIDVDRLPDHILSAGLDLLKTPSPPSDADALGMSFMAAYLLAPAPAAPSGLISPSSMGGNLNGRTLLINRHGGTGGSACLFHSAPPPFLVPSRSTRSVRASSHPPASQGGRPRPDPEPDVHASSLVRSLGSCRFPSSVGYGGQHGGRSGRSPSSSSSSIGQSPTNSKILWGWSNSSDMSHWGSSSPSNASLSPKSINASVLGPLSPFTTPSPTEMASVTSPPLPVAPQPSPIPLPVDRFTLPSIKMSDDYLAARDLILYWLRRPGFSTACSDATLITDPSNAHASQFWEGQIRMALKDGLARFLFENTGSAYFDKGFKMLQVLEDNFCPSSISNTFTTLLSLFNERQSDKEGIHEFCLQFEGNLLALSRSLVAIPQILQVMLFLRAIHSRYQGLLNQFASK